MLNGSIFTIPRMTLAKLFSLLRETKIGNEESQVYKRSLNRQRSGRQQTVSYPIAFTDLWILWVLHVSWSDACLKPTRSTSLNERGTGVIWDESGEDEDDENEKETDTVRFMKKADS